MNKNKQPLAFPILMVKHGQISTSHEMLNEAVYYNGVVG